MTPQYVSVVDAAKMLGLSHKRVRELVSTGKLGHLGMPRRGKQPPFMVITLAEVQGFLKRVASR